jgi:hypothetical protein
MHTRMKRATRSVFVRTTVTPLQARYIARLAEQANRSQAGWLFELIRAHLQEVTRPAVNGSDSGGSDVG